MVELCSEFVMLVLSRVVSVGVPLLIIALAVPLMLRVVPPNRVYGYRTNWSLASPETWYQANFLSGVALTAAGVLMLGIGLGVEAWASHWTQTKRVLVATLAYGAIISLGLLAVVLQIEDSAN
jgi:uncharacterized membrane protein